ncbi:hypothetical protein V5F34_05585 [Xanthobacter autotrophicus]|uniref:DUF707 domain-containing protein n=1 Tax=Xanthobacter autotrophicus TaxID=280 RepID=A0A6C1KG42_XANAU|nr:hypothetical protein [Xanthobacter autotrophicus]TLX43175.1 hypothetical protein FBQ73_11085 [Xanthobacter autotrophicus]
MTVRVAGECSLRAEHGAARVANGLFITTKSTDRIRAHFERVRQQTEGLVDWRLIHNPGNHVAPVEPCLDPPPEAVLPERLRQLDENGGLVPGYVDVLTVAAAWPLPHDHTWVMEFDVDYTGDWRALFERFAANDADLLTTTLVPLADDPDWYFNETALAPAHVDPACRMRSFNPLMRMSRRFMEAYAAEVRDPGWQGHFEYLLPTVARHLGLKIEDMGGDGPFCPPERRGRLYSNTPLDPNLVPGTFVYRPWRPDYFAERPQDFPQGDWLIHPVKPDTPQPPPPPAPAPPPQRSLPRRLWRFVRGKGMGS